jgi:hypothetical protein
MRANGHLPEVKILSRKEGKKLFDRQVRRSLNMSGVEFVRKWKARQFEIPRTLS